MDNVLLSGITVKLLEKTIIREYRKVTKDGRAYINNETDVNIFSSS
jgi:hypothetical protein